MSSGQVEESIFIETVNGTVMEIPVILQIQEIDCELSRR